MVVPLVPSRRCASNSKHFRHGSSASNSEATSRSGHADTTPPPARARPQLGAYFALIEVAGAAAARGRAAAARGRRPQLRAVPAAGPARPRRTVGQRADDRPGRRRRLQPQRAHLPGGPAGEGRAGRTRPGPRTTSAASPSRSPTPVAAVLAAGAARPRRGRAAGPAVRAALARGRPGTRRPARRRCATTCARRRPGRHDVASSRWGSNPTRHGCSRAPLTTLSTAFFGPCSPSPTRSSSADGDRPHRGAVVGVVAGGEHVPRVDGQRQVALRGPGARGLQRAPPTASNTSTGTPSRRR